MADANQQAQELAELMSRVNRDMELYGRMHQTTADQVTDATMKSKHGIQNFTKGTATAADAVASVGKAAMSAAGAMYEGKKGAAAFNSAIDELSNAAKLAGAALTLLVPGGPLIKGLIAGFTAVTTATAEYIKAANVMADKIYGGYNKLAKTGAAASDGMTGVYQGAKKLGLSMNELDSYVGLVGDSAKDLALFSGSVFEGRKRFEDIGAAMEPYRKQLFAAGMTQEQINEGTMGYLRLQTQLGRAQKMSNEELAVGAKKYLYEMDGLSKLTGESRQEMEKNMEAARNEQRFRAKLEQVRAEQGEEAAKRLEAANLLYSSQSKEMGQAFRDITTGMLGTEAAQKGQMGTNGKLMETTEKLIAGQIDQYEAVTATGKAASQFAKDMNFTAQMGEFNNIATDYAGQLRLGIFAEKDKTEMAKMVEKEQEKQAEGADKITKQYAENIKQQQELNKKMEDAVFKGISPALDATNKLGKVTDVVATGFEKLAGALNKLLRLIGLGEKEPAREMSKAEKEALSDFEKARIAKEKAFEGASFSQKFLGRGLTPEQQKAQDAYNDAQRRRIEVETEVANQQAAGGGVGAAPTPKSGKQELPAGVAPSTAGGGRGTVAPPAGGPPPAATTAAPVAVPAAAPPPAKTVSGGAPTTATPAKPQAQPPEGEGAKDSLDREAGPAIDKLFSFTDKSGSKSAFEGLDKTFKDAVIRAATEYQAVTGKPIQINSAKRDSEDQERLYAETVAAGRPGIGPTGMKVGKPGTSRHERGHAVDIQQYKDPVAVAAFNKQGLYQKVPNDPVHFQAKDGGVFDGPEDGYNNIVMHGTEAVIPLKNGAVPVKITGDNDASNLLLSQMGIMSTEIDKMAKQAAWDNAPSQTLDIKALQNMITGSASAFDAQQLMALNTPTFADVTAKDTSFNIEETFSNLLDSFKDTVSSNSEQFQPQLPEGLAAPGSMRDLTSILQEHSNRTGELVGLVGELLRAQKDQNSISGRLLQVATN